jgi:outer membrane protein OmpU
MKKLLLASTAVVVFAGGAMAEVVVGGSGRIGIVDNGTDTLFNSRIRITFAASSESDSGLAFGGSIRADNAAGGNIGTAGSVFVSGAFGKLSMGDVDGAAEAAVGNLSGVGYVGNGDLNEAIYLSNDQEVPTALYEYSASGFTVYLSMANPVAAPAAPKNNDEYAIGVKYAVDNYTVASASNRKTVQPAPSRMSSRALLLPSVARPSRRSMANRPTWT